MTLAEYESAVEALERGGVEGSPESQSERLYSLQSEIMEIAWSPPYQQAARNLAKRISKTREKLAAVIEEPKGFCWDLGRLNGLVIRGETYRWREKLRGAGFRWDPDQKEWHLGDRATEAANMVAQEIAVAREVARNQPPLYVTTNAGTPERKAEEQRHRAERPDLFIEMGWYA